MARYTWKQKAKPKLKNPKLRKQLKRRNGAWVLPKKAAPKKKSSPFGRTTDYVLGEFDRQSAFQQKNANEKVLPWAQQSLQGVQQLMQGAMPQVNVQGLQEALQGAGGPMQGLASADPMGFARTAQAGADTANLGLSAEGLGYQQGIASMRQGAGTQGALTELGQDIARIPNQFAQKKLEFMQSMAPVFEQIYETRRRDKASREFENQQLMAQIQAALGEEEFEREKFEKTLELDYAELGQDRDLALIEEEGRNARNAADNERIAKGKKGKVPVETVRNRNKAIAALDELSQRNWTLHRAKDTGATVKPAGGGKYRDSDGNEYDKSEVERKGISKKSAINMLMKKYGVSEKWANAIFKKRYKVNSDGSLKNIITPGF